jgi:hypothetical protein
LLQPPTFGLGVAVNVIMGGNMLMLTCTDVVAVFPFASVAVPVIDWLAPSVDIVCWAGHCTGATPPKHWKVTVTFVLFQPFVFGAGLADAVICSGGELAAGNTSTILKL